MSVTGAKGHSSESREPGCSEMSRLEIRMVAHTLHVPGPALQEGGRGDEARERECRLGALHGTELEGQMPPQFPQRRSHRSLGPAAPADRGQTLTVSAIPGYPRSYHLPIPA